MSCRLVKLLLVAVLAISIEAALPGRTLRQAGTCTRACDAAARTDPNTLRNIINEGRSICSCRCNGQGWTPMHVSVDSRCQSCIRHMITNPAWCSRYSTDNEGNTALHVAARLCRLAVVDGLIEMRFFVNRNNNAGDSPLCVASRQNDENCGQIVRNLLRAGASPCVTCSDGQTPCGGCVNQVVCDVLRQDGACSCP